MTRQQLGELILSSERQLYVTARSILKNDVDCEDVVQETIVKAFAKVNDLKKDEYGKTWLIRILINECYAFLRRRKKWVQIEECAEEVLAVKWEYKSYGELYNSVQKLPDDLRLPLVLYYVEELSCREIAAIMDITEGAVQKRLARARKKLHLDLAGQEVSV